MYKSELDRKLELLSRLPQQIKCLKSEYNERVISIDDMTYSGAGNLVITYTNELGTQTISAALATLGIKYNVLNYSELLTITDQELYDFAYVREDQGTAWLPGSLLGTYYGNGLYMWDGTTWIEDDTDVFQELTNLLSNKADKNWWYYVGAVKYTGNDTALAGGDVLECLLDAAPIYRYISYGEDVYGYPLEDSFHTNFDGTNLTGLITTRT